VPSWVEFDLLSWNIGYCGLDSSMDFFYDGGVNVRPSREKVEQNLQYVKEFLQSNDTVEFLMLQEVDINSKRSYGINMHDSIRNVFPLHWSFFGLNYKVSYVPLPISKPMGKVASGIQTLSIRKPYESYRYQYPGSFAWPTSLFMLDRCFLVNRYLLDKGMDLVLINTHNSAYDEGPIKKQEMKYLHAFLLDEYKKGNYVIAGGDWNQCPPGFTPEYSGELFDTVDYQLIDKDYLPDDWVWVYDSTVPTNRRVNIPYQKGVTATTTIDFFLLSPNVKLLYSEVVDLGFRHSDHQPVRIKVQLIR
jgi:endonuclease/exonuclease/phosphatase family metal-dependent hydrolase